VNRQYDIRTIDGPFTPADKFFTTQHYGHPAIDPATYRLKVSGLVNKPMSLSLDELRRLGNAELIFGFECSGNRRPLQGLCSNGRWTGVPLRAVLDRAGLKTQVRELVFVGADRGQEEVEFRTQKFSVEQQYGRSMTREQVAASDAFLAYALNGEPLTRHQGAPLRLLVPGWYGMANVKFLEQIHAQEDAYLGKFQARHYRTLKGEVIDGETKWTEAAITQMQLKSFLARVTKNAGGYTVLGVVLHDGTPLKSVEVRVDDGPWRPAVLDPSTRAKYSWKLFTFAWNDATPGEHTLVSRVTDVNGRVQPTSEDLESKKTFLEDNSQYPRKITIG
jgi:DMSO/TMAO reductase YedYZ molybdopterin-dependent catalytic subunit